MTGDDEFIIGCSIAVFVGLVITMVGVGVGKWVVSLVGILITAASIFMAMTVVVLTYTPPIGP